MTTARVVETCCHCHPDSSFQNYTHPEDHTRQTKLISYLLSFTERNLTICESMKANLSCPNETFINIKDIFYGRYPGSYNICTSDGPNNVSCLPTNDMEGHNSAMVYERCQMRQKCTLMVSNDTFRDPCPGVRKLLKLHYSCSPGKELLFHAWFLLR